MKIAAICDRESAVGMRFGGITNVYVPNEDQNPLNIFYEVVGRDEFGVVFVSEGLAVGMSKQLREYRLQNVLPIVVEVPDKNGHPESHVDFVSHLIKRAVGLDVEDKEVE